MKAAENFKNGFYQQPKTSNIVALIDGVCYRVAIVDGKKLISNERQVYTNSVLSDWVFEEFKTTT